MISRMILDTAKSIIGQNSALRNIIIREYKSGHYLKAAVLMIYLLPVREALRKVKTTRRYNLITESEYYHEIWKLLHISKAEDYELIRLGRNNDGGYIMLDDFADDDKIAYSFGISGDVSWDKAMASRGYDVFMYDHTIDSLPEENSRFHWFKLGISDSSMNADRLKTLEYFIEQNHHQDKHDMILKMDVEGAEWGFIENVKTETLNRFSQILFEFHGMNDPKLCDRIPNVLRKFTFTDRTQVIISAQEERHSAIRSKYHTSEETETYSLMIMMLIFPLILICLLHGVLMMLNLAAGMMNMKMIRASQS